MADADKLSQKVGEQAGRGAVSGAIKDVIGLPLNTTRRIIKKPVRKEEDVEETKEKK